MGFETLAGNEALKRRLAVRFAAEEPGHAYLISGPVGSGRHTLATLLAAAMVCTGQGGRPCLACPACRKAMGGIHPDIVRIAPEKEGGEVKVDQIRAMRADAYVRPNEARRKVYLLERADRLNAAGQNAMLKVLEDGPEYAAFLLIAENPGALLSTVRSRCETLTLFPLSDGEMEQWLRTNYPDLAQEELRRTVGEAQGLPGRAAALLERGAGEDDETAEKLVRLWLDGDEWELTKLCVGLERWERTRFADLLDAMGRSLRGRRESPERVLKLAALLDELRQAAAVNTGVGHLAGWLCAGAAQTTKNGGDPA